MVKRKAENRVKQLMKKRAKQNLQHQETIKNSFEWNKSKPIFNYLLKYGGLSFGMLATLVQLNPRTHAFHYSMKELQDEGFVVAEKDNRKVKIFRLANKAFLNPENDRPKEDDINTKELNEELATGSKVVENRKHKKKSETKINVENEFEKYDIAADKYQDNNEDDDDNESDNKIQAAFTAAEEIFQQTAGIAQEATTTAVAEIYEKVFTSVNSAISRAAAINVNNDKIKKVVALLVIASCATATTAAITDVNASAAKKASDAVKAADQAVETFYV